VTAPDVAGVLALPKGAGAIVFDMDGVLLDTLAADHGFCVAAAEAVLGRGDWVSADAVRRYFALEPDSFWRKLVEDSPTTVGEAQLDAIIARYLTLRDQGSFAPLPGVEALLEACAAAGLRRAVASSNPAESVRNMLNRAGLLRWFEVVSALGAPGVRPKPAPDLYLQAARELGVQPKDCIFIEDSATGLEAGRAAGMGWAVGVATGSASFAELRAARLADIVYDRFEAASVTFLHGEPTRKRLDTPNDFVSHMIEHIAWRIGAGIDLRWRNSDWRALGCAVGARVAEAGFGRESAATLGMIDDGAAEVLIDVAEPAGVDFDTHASLPRSSVLAMRVEQVAAGAELIELMEGLADGLDAKITVRMCTFEDPHHSWEGVYRAIGICLARLRSPS
jgi:HAD superfamily hydrolase (TIGR01509 family)